jgi:protein required for attachment to host cells
MKKTITWVATFNGAEARFYVWEREARKLKPLDLGIVDGRHRPEYADRPVRTYASIGAARGAGDPKIDGERALEEAFVARVAEALAAQAESAAFHKLCIAASPRALGAFRQSAPAALTQKILVEIAHDYVNTPPLELIDRLDDHVLP